MTIKRAISPSSSSHDPSNLVGKRARMQKNENTWTSRDADIARSLSRKKVACGQSCEANGPVDEMCGTSQVDQSQSDSCSSSLANELANFAEIQEHDTIRERKQEGSNMSSTEVFARFERQYPDDARGTEQSNIAASNKADENLGTDNAKVLASHPLTQDISKRPIGFYESPSSHRPLHIAESKSTSTSTSTQSSIPSLMHFDVQDLEALDLGIENRVISTTTSIIPQTPDRSAPYVSTQKKDEFDDDDLDSLMVHEELSPLQSHSHSDSHDHSPAKSLLPSSHTSMSSTSPRLDWRVPQHYTSATRTSPLPTSVGGSVSEARDSLGVATATPGSDSLHELNPRSAEHENVRDGTRISPSVNPVQIFVRGSFPPSVPDDSPILGVTNRTVLRTCCRIGEAIRAACCPTANINIDSSTARNVGNMSNREIIIELYARVISSTRVGLRQEFIFADLFTDKTPYLPGIFCTWHGVPLWDLDAAAFLGPAAQGKICRAIGRIRRIPQSQPYSPHSHSHSRSRSGNSPAAKSYASPLMTILSIWECSWEDVQNVKNLCQCQE